VFSSSFYCGLPDAYDSFSSLHQILEEHETCHNVKQVVPTAKEKMFLKLKMHVEQVLNNQLQVTGLKTLQHRPPDFPSIYVKKS